MERWMTDEVAPVSVVIAAYDAERTLGAALASALGQVPRPAQVIVVDDGSRDGTAAVAASFPGVQVIRQDNQGPSAARNTGIRAASEPWVAFLDADDVWLPGKLGRQFAALERHPGAVLLACDWVRADPEGVVEQAAGDPETLVRYRDLLVLNRFQTSTVLVRASVLERCGGFATARDGAEDWDMWLRCAVCGPVIKLDVPLVVYRDEPSSYSKDLVRLYTSMLTVLERERSGSYLEAKTVARVLAWHYLRFAVAFVRDGQRRQARRALSDAHTAGLDRHLPAATVRYLLPFLSARAARRLRKSRV
jgi:glycosyltransferase involved in cell wall biosynthesis